VIDLYSWATPNGVKVHIMLEEVELPYRVHPIDIGAGDQFDPEYLKLNPNNKIPAIVDSESPDRKPFTVFESGAILVYLAEKTGKLLPGNMRGRHTVMQWLMFQMGGIGPMLGQAHHFRQYAPEKIPYAIDRYTNEARRLYCVLDKRLGEEEYLAGEYSIADIATWPWIRLYDRQGQDLDDFPNIRRWHEAIGARPAAQKGVELLSGERKDFAEDKQALEALFGNTQYERR